MDKTQATPLYAYKNYVTDKESFGFDPDGSRVGETPNIVMDAGSVELAGLIVQSVNRSPYYERMRDLIIEMSERLDGVYGGKNNIDKDLLGKAQAILRETEGK